MYAKGTVLCPVDCDPRVSRNEVAPEENETNNNKNVHTFLLSLFFSQRIPVLLPNAPPIVKQSKS